MSHPVLFELERNKQRLDYYLTQKNLVRTRLATTSRKKSPLDKWIEIYEERVKKLERQAAKIRAQAGQLH
jgi:hypothetical protein